MMDSLGRDRFCAEAQAEDVTGGTVRHLFETVDGVPEQGSVSELASRVERSMAAPVNSKGASRKDSLGSFAFFNPKDGDGRLNARRRVLPPMPGAPAQLQ
jgi:hypothetical protein